MEQLISCIILVMTLSTIQSFLYRGKRGPTVISTDLKCLVHLCTSAYAYGCILNGQH